MTLFVTGLILSIVIATALTFLFSYEEEKGVRLLPSFRAKLDYYALRLSRLCAHALDLVGSNSIRQIFHFILHSLLKGILYLNKKWEQVLRNMMRVNKSFARNAERERVARTKLEEVALHKMQTALTPEEKKKRKHTMLEG